MVLIQITVVEMTQLREQSVVYYGTLLTESVDAILDDREELSEDNKVSQVIAIDCTI
jgi:hypothetical protein